MTSARIPDFQLPRGCLHPGRPSPRRKRVTLAKAGVQCIKIDILDSGLHRNDVGADSRFSIATRLSAPRPPVAPAKAPSPRRKRVTPAKAGVQCFKIDIPGFRFTPE